MISKGSLQKQKRPNLTPLLIFLFLYPYMVGFTPDSTSSYVETLFGIGTGQYIYHDCSGAHTRRFADAGIYIGKKFEGPYRTGILLGGWTGDRKGAQAHLFPDLALDWKYFSIGTTGVRIGSWKELYVEGRWLDQPPLFTGKGAIRFGIGGRVNEHGTRLWLGTNALPYDPKGIAAQVEFPYREKVFIFLNSRYGRDSGMDEFGISIGMRIVAD